MKVILFATAILLVGTQAQAAWVNGPNQEIPYFSGTDRSLSKAQGYYRHHVRYHHVHRYHRYRR